MSPRKLIVGTSLSLIYIGSGLVFFAFCVLMSWCLIFIISTLDNYTNGILAVGLLGICVISIGMIFLTVFKERDK